MTKIEGESDYRFVSRESMRTDAEYRDQVCAWIRANGLDPADVPADAVPVVSRKDLTIDVWDRNEAGKMVMNAAENGMLSHRVTVPLKVKPTDKWVIHWLGSFEAAP